MEIKYKIGFSGAKLLGIVLAVVNYKEEESTEKWSFGNTVVLVICCSRALWHSLLFEGYSIQELFSRRV